MKKCISFILSLILVGGIFAQNSNTLSLGPRIGVNMANVSHVENSTLLIGFVGGLTSTYSINENSGITVDLLFSQEGFGNDNSEVDNRLNYLDIPIYYNLFFSDLGDAFRPKVYIGFAPGFLVSAKVDDRDIKDQSNGFALDLTGGLGFNYRLGERLWLNTDLRAFLGLLDVRDEDFQEGDKVTNQVIQFSMGVAYGF